MVIASDNEEDDFSDVASVTSSCLSQSQRTAWTLDYIDVENFKSFSGQTRIGPLRQFNAVIGPNGSGKSNLMDAISFVMGENSNSLRIRRFNELIHGAPIGRPVSQTARVSALFRSSSNPQVQKLFSRVVRGSSCEYIVNQAVVTKQKYFEELKAVGINVKGKNFLVFQGAVENIAMKSGKERTELLEEICGSKALKEAYDNAKAEMTEANQRMEKAHNKKKALVAERKEIKVEVQEATKFNELVAEMNNKEIQICLFKLYHLERDIEQYEDQKILNNRDLRNLETLRKKTENIISESRKVLGLLNLSYSTKESSYEQLEKEKEKKVPRDKLIGVQQKQKHLENKAAKAEKSLTHAISNKTHQDEDLKQLQIVLERAMEKEKELLEQHDETQFEGRVDVSFRDTQIQEYWELKKEVMAQTSEEEKVKDLLEATRKDKNDVFGSLNRRRKALEGNLELVNHEIKEKKKLGERIFHTIEELQHQLEAKKDEAAPLRAKITNAEAIIAKLQPEYEKGKMELDCMKIDRHEMERRRRKAEVLQLLQDRFRGVIDRVANLCKFRHPSYKIALTKVVGRKMDAIVVETEKTARDCIMYLKEQMKEPEVFLPLDLLDVKPIRARFREQQDMHLAYDLLQFQKGIEKAIIYCTRNTVICNTALEASKVASGEIFGEPTDAVSLDGTSFSASGIISGGLANLERQARRWDEKDLTEKDEQLKTMQSEIREAMRASRSKIDLEGLDQEISGLEKRLKFADTDFKNHVATAKSLEQQKGALEEELQDVMNRWADAEAALAKISNEIKKVVKVINKKEDDIFGIFCEQVGIPSIRAYEERDLRAAEEFKSKRTDILNEIESLKARISFEMEHQKTNEENIKRWEKTIADLKRDSKQCKKEEEKMRKDISSYDIKLQSIQAELDQIKKAIEEKSKEIKEEMRNLNQFNKMHLQTTKTLSHIEHSCAQAKSDQHEILKDCKISGIEIPFAFGSFDDINVACGSDSECSTPVSSVPQNLTSQVGYQISFETLPASLKQLVGNPGAIKMAEQKLAEERREIESKISDVRAPDQKAKHKWDLINEKASKQQAEHDEIRKEVKALSAAFHKIKTERVVKFQRCFDKVSGVIDGIYKRLTQSESSQAVLSLENPEEPFLGGVSYHCVAPGKRFQLMENLSGGEKTLAALALLFAIHSYEPSPVFVLDEIDAALDNTNIGKVASYIYGQTRNNMQIIVISLKEEFYEHADALLGVAPSVEELECITSKLYTLDLTQYEYVDRNMR